MTPRLRKVAVGVCMFASAGGVAYGYGCPAVVDEIWMAGVTAANMSVSAAITAATETISYWRVYNMQRVMSGIRVLTKQVRVSSEKMSAADLASKQASAAFDGEIADRKAVFETTMEYNPVTGQGYNPCSELERTKKIAVAIGEANNSMQERVLREIDAAPGRVVGDVGAVVSKRLEDARGVYCTADEARAGVCSAPGTLAGRDRDSGHFFTSYAVGTPEAEAKNAMLNNMYGVPQVAPTGDTAKSPAGQSFYAAKREYDAFRSISQATMKAIQSWTESRGVAGNTIDSVMDAIGKKVATYAGGENYPEWEKQLTSQSEHGLLVELAKKRAFQLYMSNLEYQQFEHIETNVAALVAMKARDLPSDLEGARSRAGAQKVR